MFYFKLLTLPPRIIHGLPGGSVVKTAPANAGDANLIAGVGRSPGEANGNPLQFQYSCLGNPMGRVTWQAIVHGVPKELDMTWQLNNNNRTIYCQVKIEIRMNI